MVLIFSFDHDHSTNEVIKWLNFFETPFIRINTFQELPEKISHAQFGVNSNSNFCFQQIKKMVSCVWYRRNPINDVPFIDSDYFLNSTTHTSCYHEMIVIRNLIIDELDDKYWLNHPLNSSLNKISVLNKAQELGLSIPPTILTSNKHLLMEFKQKHIEIITKPLYEVMKLEDKNNNKYMNRTSLVDNNCINNLDDSFFPSLFQKNIEKSFEVRTVFLEGKCYSMAIFSQTNEKTKIDFRHYNTESPNRVTAFNLPKEMEIKIQKLMENLYLNFGSLDFIVDKNYNFYFLEINPVGQFGMTSTPNNYQIEKEVALILNKKNNEFTTR